MSSVPVNDENSGLCPGGKGGGGGSIEDIFDIEQPTGRQSILHALSLPGDEMPIKSKGGYLLDFDNLDAMDPFQCSNKMLLSPAGPAFEDLPVPQNEPEPENVCSEAVEKALDTTLPFNPSVENSLADVSADVCSTESSIVTVIKNSCLEDQESSTATPDKQPAAAVSFNSNTSPAVAVAVASTEDSPLPGRGAYSLDFDNINAINPFQTGGSKINNSPPLCRTQPGNQPEVSSVKTTNPENVPLDVPEAVKEAPVQPEAKPIAMVAPISNDLTNAPDSEEVPGKPANSPNKGGPVKLEFVFDDGAEVKRKPPPKFGKRLPTAKASEKKPAPEKQPEPPQEPTVVPAGSNDEVETPLPKAAYSFDFDQFDDANFNPFGTNVKMGSSPVCKVPPAGEKMAMAEPTSQQAENQAVVLCAGGDVTNTEASTSHGQIPLPEEPMSLPASNPGLKLEAECRMATPEPADLTQQHEWNSQTVVLEHSEEFVPGATFMQSDFDGQFDYLEQFGSTNFKDSALRKQSLYLKFDPLLRESPKKAGAPVVHVNPPRPSALASRYGRPPVPI
ncbi:hypothetical protein CRUP_033024 [Coryphaenoides rupestris]|nr:hypothetical protein CRUP_033024 [Coryphaenoides rupestris]